MDRSRGEKKLLDATKRYPLPFSIQGFFSSHFQTFLCTRSQHSCIYAIPDKTIYLSSYSVGRSYRASISIITNKSHIFCLIAFEPGTWSIAADQWKVALHHGVLLPKPLGCAWHNTRGMLWRSGESKPLRWAFIWHGTNYLFKVFYMGCKHNDTALGRGRGISGDGLCHWKAKELERLRDVESPRSQRKKQNTAGQKMLSPNPNTLVSLIRSLLKSRCSKSEMCGCERQRIMGDGPLIAFDSTPVGNNTELQPSFD